MIKKMLFTSLYVLNCFIATSQTGTEFWFAVPEVSEFGSYFLDRPIALRMTTGTTAADVVVSQPAGGGMPDQLLSIPANSTQTLTLTPWIDYLEAKPADNILNYGLKITSTASITVYYEVITGIGGYAPIKANPEAFILKGHNALGMDFVIPGQNILFNGPEYYPTPYNSFIIIATEDNTNITITPSHNIAGHSAGIPFSILLDKGQVYSATATSQEENEHLDGSWVISDKPIAVTVSDDLLRLGFCSDLGGDQIIPIDRLGTEYIAMNGMLEDPGSYIFLTATEDNTDVSKDGVFATTIDHGETYSMLIGAASTYISATKPVAAWQLSGIGCEIGLAQLPQIYCTGSTSVSYVRSMEGSLYVNIFTTSGDEGSFTVNGSSSILTASMFDDVPGTGGEWVAAVVLLPVEDYPAGSVIKIENSSAKFHMGVLDGDITGGASFGYFSDFGSGGHLTALSNTPCTGDTLKLFATTMAEGYSWTGPGGFTSTEQNPVIANISPANNGIYIVTSTNSCGTVSDTVEVVIYDYPPVNAGDDTIICKSASITLTANSSGTAYSWSGPAGFSSNEPNPVLQNPVTGNYSVTVSNNGCSASDDIFITVENDPLVSLGMDTVICYGDQIALSSAENYSNGTYLWNNGATDESITVSSADTYWLKISVPPGCTSSDTIKIDNKYCSICHLQVPTAFSPNSDSKNDIFRPVAEKDCYIFDYHLSIFNRWGQLIFSSVNLNIGWNGIIHQKLADVGTYMYYITYKEDQTGKEIKIKGDVTLLR